MKTDKEWEARARDLMSEASRRSVAQLPAWSPESWAAVAALQLGREMAEEARADERERCAKRIERLGRNGDFAVSRHAALVRNDPKTREQALEEALIRLRGSATACSCGASEQNRTHEEWCGVAIARSALEWKLEQPEKK